MKIYYHNDADGMGCAAQLVRANIEPCCKRDLIPVDYTGIDFSCVKENELVYIVDYSLSSDKLVESVLDLYNNVTENIVWIDHHKTSERMIEKYDFLNILEGLTDTSGKYCGAVLVWVYLNTIYAKSNEHKESLDDVCKKLPYWLTLLNDYDCWLEKIKETNFFILGLDSSGKEDIFGECWDKLIKDDYQYIQDLISKGHIIQSYIGYNNMALRKDQAYSFDTKYGKVLAINRKGNSTLFGKEFNNEEYSIFMVYYYNGSSWIYSLFSREDGPDVGSIAEFIYNNNISIISGGGHKHAAGFVSKEMIEDISSLVK